MAKIKIQPAAIVSKADFISSVNRVAMLERETQLAEARYNMLDQKLKARREKFLAAREAEKKSLLAACAAFAADNPSMLDPGRRSAETEQARYGFRMGNPTVAAQKGFTLKSALEALRQKSKAIQKRFLSFPDPKLNKDAIRDSMPPKLLNELGLHIVQTDSFFIEPKGDHE